MPLTSGTRLGSYEVLSPLGAGGMGEVYRAHDFRLGRDVAIKLLPEALASSPERLARFQREARTVAALNHPNIVTLHSIEDSGGVRFLTMELVEGSDLSTLIVPGGLPLAKVLDVAIPLADALVAAHEKRVVHRDLKPANVMLTRDGRVKVLDFGLAKLMEIGSDLELTRAATVAAPISEVGQVVGTAAYMSPEQIRGEEVDSRSDLFSFGILVYEMASGKRPFAGHTAADVSSAILRDHPPSLSSVRGDVAPELGRIVERCLEKSPRERIQTALDVANELRGLKRTMERGTSPVAKPAQENVASVAVLPFVNRSASADDEYFSDGLADELLNVLAKIRGLRVAARTSAFQFKGKSEDMAVIGQKLHVSTLLEGSVRKAGNRVRISVQLVKAEDGYQLWSETYDRTLDDIFEVQDDIARSVVKELRSALLGEEHDSKASGEVKAEVAQAVEGRGTDPEAHRLYLLARHLTDRANPTDMRKAIQYLEQALALDPQFAEAWVKLGAAFTNLMILWDPSSREDRNRAWDAVERALAVNPNLPHAHALLAGLQSYDLDWRAAEVSSKRALELAPTDVAANRRAATLAHSQGHFEESIQFNLRALEIDPLSSSTLANLAYVYFNRGRMSEAESFYRRALEIAPGRTGAHAWLSLTLLGQGRSEEALAEAEHEPMIALRLWAFAIVHHALGHPSESQQALDQLTAEYGKMAAAQIAQAHAARGEKDEAFAWLDRAIQQGDAFELKPAWYLRSLHSDPRWNLFLEKMGLV